MHTNTGPSAPQSAVQTAFQPVQQAPRKRGRWAIVTLVFLLLLGAAYGIGYTHVNQVVEDTEVAKQYYEASMAEFLKANQELQNSISKENVERAERSYEEMQRCRQEYKHQFNRARGLGTLFNLYNASIPKFNATNRIAPTGMEAPQSRSGPLFYLSEISGARPVSWPAFHMEFTNTMISNVNVIDARRPDYGAVRSVIQEADRAGVHIEGRSASDLCNDEAFGTKMTNLRQSDFAAFGRLGKDLYFGGDRVLADPHGMLQDALQVHDAMYRLADSKVGDGVRKAHDKARDVADRFQQTEFGRKATRGTKKVMDKAGGKLKSYFEK